jgi:hypothetical protein
MKIMSELVGKYVGKSTAGLCRFAKYKMLLIRIKTSLEETWSNYRKYKKRYIDFAAKNDSQWRFGRRLECWLGRLV